MPGACARAFLSFLVLACGRWGSAAPPWALVVVAVPRCREWPLFCASAVGMSAVGMSVIYVCFPSFTVGCGALRGVRVGGLHYTGVRHAGDTPSEGFV